MSGPRPPRSSYHQKALQQIRNSLQPFEAGSTPPPDPPGRGYSSSSSSPCPPLISSPSRQSPVHQTTPRGGIEYRAQQYPFVPSQVPASVQQLLRRIDTVSPSSPSSSSSNSPTSQLQQLQQQHQQQQQQQQQPIVKKPTLVIKSTAVQKPVLQTAVPYSSTINLPPPPPYPSPGSHPPPPLPPKPAKSLPKKQVPVIPPPSIINGDYEERKQRLIMNHEQNDYHRLSSNNQHPHPPPLTNNLMNNNNNYHEYQLQQPSRLDLPPRIQRNGIIPPPNTTTITEHNGIGRNSPATSDTQSETSSITTNTSNTTKSGHRPLPPPTPPTTTTNSEPPLPVPETNNNNKLETNQPPAPLTNGNGEIIHTHESPIPERKILSREKEEERFESKVRVYSPQAFKFFMEQHVENVIKSHQERLNRRKQLESEMRKIGLSEEAQAQMRRMLSQKESNYIRLKRAKMHKSLFKTIRTIGVGAFGEVALVRKIDTQHLYAMKTLRKSDVLRRNQVAHVKAERDILAEADNEWVVKLYYSFQDMDHLYFVMDYIPGGDLMSLLIKKGIFEEPLAQFYIAELTCAVESVHRMGFIHRDIKPDNILIDRDGHIKLTDFGLCTGFRWTHNSKYYQDSPVSICNCDSSKWQACVCDEKDKPLDRRRRTNVQRCLAHSLVGTPNYIAPEVLLRTGYTQLCDWWSVGVILYEMLVGQPPFLAPTPAETQYKVINWNTTLRIPPQANLSNNAKDLILKLCTDHSRRLGKSGAGNVKSHPFFTSIDFDAGLRRTTAPFIPQIRHPTDTSNFDPVDGESEKGEDVGENPFESNQYHGFFEFTFRRFFDDAYYNNEDGGPVYV